MSGCFQVKYYIFKNLSIETYGISFLRTVDYNYKITSFLFSVTVDFLKMLIVYTVWKKQTLPRSTMALNTSRPHLRDVK